MAVISSWIIHTEVNVIKMLHLEFRRQITTFLVERKELVSHHGHCYHVEKEVRISDGHYIVPTTQEHCIVRKKQKQLRNIFIVMNKNENN